VGREFVGSLPNPLVVVQMAARMLAACDLGHYHRHQLRFQRPTTSPTTSTAPANSTGPTISALREEYRRVDRPHGSARRGEAVVTPLKTG